MKCFIEILGILSFGVSLGIVLAIVLKQAK
jgi:hypothetical protein